MAEMPLSKPSPWSSARIAAS